VREIYLVLNSCLDWLRLDESSFVLALARRLCRFGLRIGQWEKMNGIGLKKNVLKMRLVYINDKLFS
jgi:hypothetical protein